MGHSADIPSMVAQRAEVRITQITSLQAVTVQVDKRAGIVDNLLVASGLVRGSMEIAHTDGPHALQRFCWGAGSHRGLFITTTRPVRGTPPT